MREYFASTQKLDRLEKSRRGKGSAELCLFAVKIEASTAEETRKEVKTLTVDLVLV